MMKPSKKTPAKKNISPPTRKRRIAARAAPAAAKALRDQPTGRSQGAQPRRHVTRLPSAGVVAYGEAIVSTLSRQLTIDYGRGFEEKNLRRMVQFAEGFPDEAIVATLWRQLSWSHFRELLPLKHPLQRQFYAEICRIEGWSSLTSPNGAAKDSPGQRPGKRRPVENGALKGRPNHGRFGRPFRALTTNNHQPRATPWETLARRRMDNKETDFT